MDYATAKGIAAEHAPQLLFGAETGMDHINVFKEGSSKVFSIHLPAARPDDYKDVENGAAAAVEAERQMFIDALDEAAKHLGA